MKETAPDHLRGGREGEEHTKTGKSRCAWLCALSLWGVVHLGSVRSHSGGWAQLLLTQLLSIPVDGLLHLPVSWGESSSTGAKTTSAIRGLKRKVSSHS